VTVGMSGPFIDQTEPDEPDAASIIQPPHPDGHFVAGPLRNHTWPVGLVFLDLILMREFLAIEVGASIDPAPRIPPALPLAIS
jgi:hypothetical protein